MKEIIIKNEQQANRLIIYINWFSAVFGYGLFYLKRFYNINDIPYLYLNSSLTLFLIFCIVAEVWYYVAFRQGKYSPKLKYYLIFLIVAVNFTMIAMSKEAFMIGLYFYPLIAAGLYYTNRIMIYSIILNLISITVLLSQKLIDLNLEVNFIAFFTAVAASFVACIFILMGHLTQSTRYINTLQCQEKELQDIHARLQEANAGMSDKQEQLLIVNQHLTLSNNKLEKAYNQLQHTQSQIVKHEKMASIGQLSAGVAHEINTPVGAIKSNIDISVRLVDNLKKELERSDIPGVKDMAAKLEGIINISAQSCTRIEQIVRSLRNFARLDADKNQQINIHILIENTLVLLNNKLRDRAEIIKEYGNIPEIECYPGQLSQVLMNIMQNAIEAIDQRGIIKIKTEAANNGLYISIKDNGKGIEKEKIDKLFDLGFTTKGNRTKTGLGLATAYRIIENHSGTIELKTKKGEGTEVIIFLPANKAALS